MKYFPALVATLLLVGPAHASILSIHAARFLELEATFAFTPPMPADSLAEGELMVHIPMMLTAGAWAGAPDAGAYACAGPGAYQAGDEPPLGYIRIVYGYALCRPGTTTPGAGSFILFFSLLVTATQTQTLRMRVLTPDAKATLDCPLTLFDLTEPDDPDRPSSWAGGRWRTACA